MEAVVSTRGAKSCVTMRLKPGVETDGRDVRFPPVADIHHRRDKALVNSRLAVILIPFFGLLASCAVAPEESHEAERPRSAQSSDEGLEWKCETFPPEVRGFCFQFMALKRPTARLVDRVEARLASHPCINSLARWQRLYSFARVRGDPRSVDEDRIAFQFREAGFEDFRSERRVTAPEVWVQVDDRPYNFVAGYFDLKSGELTVDFCGANIGAP